LGVGTNAPTEIVEIVRNAAVNNRVLISNSNTTATTARATLEVKVGASMTGTFSAIQGTGVFVGSSSNDRVLLTTGGTPHVNIQLNGNSNFGNSVNDLGARLGIKGSGSTSATTSLLVQNSAGTQLLKVADDGTTTANIFSTTGVTSINNGTLYIGSNFVTTYGQSIGFFGATVASAIVEIQSTTRGFLPPRMTTTQRNAISSPATGLVLYDSTTNKLQCYNGSTWNDLF
jgi:hypothetical protein